MLKFDSLPRPTECRNCNTPLRPTQEVCEKCNSCYFHHTLQPDQRLLLDLMLAEGPEVPTVIGAGGSRGSSKSRGGREIVLILSQMFKGITIYVGARNLGTLIESWIEKYRLEHPDMFQFYKASPRPEFAFPNGTRVAFIFADTREDLTRVERGPEGYFMVWEQAEQLDEGALEQVTTPNRWPSAPLGGPKTLFLFNPGGIGAEYLRRVFYLKVYRENENPKAFFFLPMYSWRNAAWQKSSIGMTDEEWYDLPTIVPVPADGRYDEAWLQSLPDNHQFKLFVTRTAEGRKMWGKPESLRMGDLFGRFDAFAGQYFAGVWDQRTHVLSTSQVDAIVQYWWTCWTTGDLGWGHSTAIYWAAYGKLSPSEALHHLEIQTEWPLDVIVVYRELVIGDKVMKNGVAVGRMAEAEIGQRMVEITPEAERRHLSLFAMGSDTKITDRNSQHSRRELIDAITVPAGFPPIRSAKDGPGSRVINARIMYEMMRRTTVMRSENPPQERPTEKTSPLVFISAECPHLIDAIPLLQNNAQEGKPDDVKKTDSVADDVFDGAKMLLAEYSGLVTTPPREVRRDEYVQSGIGKQAQYIRGIEFDSKDRASTHRVKRR